MKTARYALLMLSACAAPASMAGPYTDDLAKCLVESTTKQDREALVRWMFAAASAHPAVGSLATVPAETVDQANKATAELFMKLLTDSCLEKTQKAILYEGQVAIASSFQVLGQVAGNELFASPEVAGAMGGLQNHIDENKLKALLQPETPKK